MYEWCLDAVVIDREDIGEADARLTLYTREFGRFAAKAKSIRKITSKLSAHLGRGDLARVRIVARGEDAQHAQLVDALRMKKTGLSEEALRFLKDVMYENDPDERLWDVLERGVSEKEVLLDVLGLNPRHASCVQCASRPVDYFLTASHAFACHGCIMTAGRNEVSYKL